MHNKASPIFWKNPHLRGRIVQLDGIRGLAILLVIFWHYVYSPFERAISNSSLSYALVPLGLAWSGVDLFFVLSGFLIGGILCDMRSTDNYYRTFYARRLFRIFPVYFIWVALFFLGVYLAAPDGPPVVRSIFNRTLPLWSYPLFVQNIAMAFNGTFGASWIGITWSLAVEEQFYLILPFIIRRLSRKRLLQVAALSIVLAPLLRVLFWASGNRIMAPYTLLPCRADALGCGLLIALACRNERVWMWLLSHRAYVTGAFLVLGLGVVGMTLYPRGSNILGITWLAAFYGLLLLLAILPRDAGKIFLLSAPWLVKLGTVSYSVYITHQGINALLHAAILREYPFFYSWLSPCVTALSLVAVLSIAALSWRMLEKPLIRLAHSRYRYAVPAPRDLGLAAATAR